MAGGNYRDLMRNQWQNQAPVTQHIENLINLGVTQFKFKYSTRSNALGVGMRIMSLQRQVF